VIGNEQKSGGRIVVGVDGSPSSKAALAWAVRQSQLTGASVEAVIAWQYPVLAGGMAFAPLWVLEGSDLSVLAENVLTDAVEETVASDDRVRIRSTVREGDAARVLLETANGADLLVVGSRGHGGLAEALLGSVSQHCVHHARCPVVIVRPGRTC
jgi:nucleotide-binding universal stress UspA family protein